MVIAPTASIVATAPSVRPADAMRTVVPIERPSAPATAGKAAMMRSAEEVAGSANVPWKPVWPKAAVATAEESGESAAAWRPTNGIRTKSRRT